jgi:hypothetical protein
MSRVTGILIIIYSKIKAETASDSLLFRLYLGFLSRYVSISILILLYIIIRVLVTRLIMLRLYLSDSVGYLGPTLAGSRVGSARNFDL